MNDQLHLKCQISFLLFFDYDVDIDGFMFLTYIPLLIFRLSWKNDVEAIFGRDSNP